MFNLSIVDSGLESLPFDFNTEVTHWNVQTEAQWQNQIYVKIHTSKKSKKNIIFTP